MRLEPFQLAREQREFRLQLPLEDFPRLCAEAASAEGSVAVNVAFFLDDQRRARIRGQLVCSMSLPCANCGEDGPLQLTAPIDVCVVRTDEAARALDRSLEPLVLEGIDATPAELFEDDLLLELPERPCSDLAACPHAQRLAAMVPSDDAGPGDDKQESEHPFAALAALKKS